MGLPTDPPAHDAAREGVDDKSHVNETLPCRHLGKVADPQHFGSRCLELTVHLVQRTWLRLVWDGRPVFLAKDDTFEPNVPHQSSNRTAGHI